VRILYVLLTHLLLPVVVIVESWQALRRPDYRGRVGPRLGFVARSARPGPIWVHAVSVGEVQAAAALIRELRLRYPERELVVSTVTPTGAQRVKSLFKGEVRHAYLPYDVAGPVRRFLDRVAPCVAIVLETEIWPTLYRELNRRHVPLVLASARVTERSVGRYRRMAGLFREALAEGIVIGAQSEADAGRFRTIGAPAERVFVTGNVKYDLEIPPAAIDAGRQFRARCAPARNVWIAGSTHEGEEAAALEAHALIRRAHPGALLILAPRHPQRFESVRALLRRRAVAFAERSAGSEPTAQDEVFLLDTLGELQAFYAAADVAFVGGSLVPIGGHNLLEPAALARPVVSGPYTGNAPDIAAALAAHGALRIVDGAEALAGQVTAWFDDPATARASGERGRQLVADGRGAVRRLLQILEPLIGRA